MLKGVSPFLSPELLKTLYEMGHGDELLLADAHFPGHTLGRRGVRADGLNFSQLLDCILHLFALKKAEDAVPMMQPNGGDAMHPGVEAAFSAAVRRHSEPSAPSEHLARAA